MNDTILDMQPEGTSLNWSVLLLGIIALVGTIGNYLVCCAILRDKTLKTTTNYYVFSLALSDIAVCIVVLPVAITKDFCGYWIFYEWTWTCPLFIFLDVLLCTVSIYHLATVSILRFFVIQFPFKHAYFKSKRLTISIILFIWIISILISSNILFIALFDLESVFAHRQCYVKNDYFIVYGSIFSFVIPLFIMIIMFLLMARKLQSKLANFEKTTASETYHQIDGLRRHARAYSSYKAPSSSRESFKQNSIDSRLDSIGLSKRNSKFSRLFIINAPDTTHLETQSEAKALQVLFIVFIIFLIAWLPYCLVNVATVINPSHKQVYNNILNWLTYLGYLSSSINPMIYAVFNRRFRRNFVRILYRQRNKSLKKIQTNKDNQILQCHQHHHHKTTNNGKSMSQRV